MGGYPFAAFDKVGGDAQCTGVRHVIDLVVYRLSPRHPPHSVPVIGAIGES